MKDELLITSYELPMLNDESLEGNDELQVTSDEFGGGLRRLVGSN